MCKKTYFFCFVFILTIHNLLAQPYYNQRQDFLNANSVWIFPDSSGIDFKKIVKPITSHCANVLGRPIGECVASVCHPSTGELLFYSNGRECWAADGKLMPNGNALLGNGKALTTAQGVLSIPVLGKDNQYYLFSMTANEVIQEGGLRGSLFYSVIDMSLNGGKGDIVAGKKNLLLDTVPLSEAMIAIPGDNCDIWLLVHHFSMPMYRAFHITKEGVSLLPVTSSTIPSIGSFPGLLGNQYGYFAGSLAVSPNRKFVAMNTTIFGPPHGGLTLARFDALAGNVYDEIQIGAVIPVSGAYVAFSPDNSKLYSGEGSFLVQYDISKFDVAAIDASRFVLGAPAVNGLRLYNDTIYGVMSGNKFICKIAEPNKVGSAASFNISAIYVDSGNYKGRVMNSEFVLPYVPLPVRRILSDTVVCTGFEEGIILKPGLIERDFKYTWDNASSDSLVKVFKRGRYWVTYGNGCYEYSDTFIIGGGDIVKPVIRVEEQRLSTGEGYYSYQWLLDGKIIPGAISNFYDVLVNGNYQVVISNEYGCSDTSDMYSVTNVSINELTILNQILIYPNPANDKIQINSPVLIDATLITPDGKIIQQVKNAKTIFIQNLSLGIYFIRIDDKEGNWIKTEKLIKAK